MNCRCRFESGIARVAGRITTEMKTRRSIYCEQDNTCLSCRKLPGGAPGKSRLRETSDGAQRRNPPEYRLRLVGEKVKMRPVMWRVAHIIVIKIPIHQRGQK